MALTSSELMEHMEAAADQMSWAQWGDAHRHLVRARCVMAALPDVADSNGASITYGRSQLDALLIEVKELADAEARRVVPWSIWAALGFLAGSAMASTIVGLI